MIARRPAWFLRNARAGISSSCFEPPRLYNPNPIRATNGGGHWEPVQGQMLKSWVGIRERVSVDHRAAGTLRPTLCEASPENRGRHGGGAHNSVSGAAPDAPRQAMAAAGGNPSICAKQDSLYFRGDSDCAGSQRRHSQANNTHALTMLWQRRSDENPVRP